MSWFFLTQPIILAILGIILLVVACFNYSINPSPVGFNDDVNFSALSLKDGKTYCVFIPKIDSQRKKSNDIAFAMNNAYVMLIMCYTVGSILIFMSIVWSYMLIYRHEIFL